MPYKPPSIGQPAKAKSRGRAWTATSKTIRQIEPLCRFCLVKGFNVPAVCVDHIKPLSEGGLSIAENLQPLCRECHARKSKMDSADGAIYGEHPSKITIVVGPPGAGKSYLVKNQLIKGDIIVDFDELVVAMTSEQKWSEGGLAHASMIRTIRNAVIAYSMGGRLNGRLWVLMADLSASLDLQSKTLGSSLIILDTKFDTCIDAVRQRMLPEARTISAKNAISKFRAQLSASLATIKLNPLISFSQRGVT